MEISPFIFLILPYILIISLFIYGWLKLSMATPVSGKGIPFVSILVPVKDEEKNLPFLLGDLLRQDYPPTAYEIILIDDHSEDNTRAVISRFCETNPSVRLILNSRSGKKSALWEGINSSRGELVLTTDGDCRFPGGWLSAMVRCYKQFPESLIIGPVFMEEKNGLLNQFQSLEFLSLIATAAGASGLKKPILCNGANLGANRNLFFSAEAVYHSTIASGDDIFLLLELKKNKVPVVFVKDRNAAVVTGNTSGIRQFFGQRTRWTYKSRFYRDIDIVTVALIVLFTNLLLMGSLIYSLTHTQFFIDFLLFYLLKCFVDYILLYYVAKYFNRSKLLKFFLIHQLLYVFYVSFVGIAGHFSAGKWKGRTR